METEPSLWPAADSRPNLQKLASDSIMRSGNSCLNTVVLADVYRLIAVGQELFDQEFVHH